MQFNDAKWCAQESVLKDKLLYTWRALAVVTTLAMFGLIAAIIIMLPLKEVAVHTFRVDNATGAIDQMLGRENVLMKQGDMVTRDKLNQYVTRRAGYNYDSQLADYNFLDALSSVEVSRDLGAEFTVMRKAYTDKLVITATVREIIENEDQTATVRYYKTVKDKVKGSSRTDWTAVISFQYGTLERKMKPEEALNNPLGFQVTSWREMAVVSP